MLWTRSQISNHRSSAMQVLTQTLRLSAVQIRRHRDPKPVGTGFLVSSDGLVATSRHVVADAGVVPDSGEAAPGVLQLVLDRSSARRGIVDVYIPAIREQRFIRDGRLVEAVVKCCPRPPFADDVALLELVEPFGRISAD
jgi:hypothetical protein